MEGDLHLSSLTGTKIRNQPTNAETLQAQEREGSSSGGQTEHPSRLSLVGAEEAGAGRASAAALAELLPEPE